GGRRGDLRRRRPRPGRRPERPGGGGPARDRARARRRRPKSPRAAQARRSPHASRPHRRAEESGSAQGAEGAPVLQALASGAVARRYFGTDGVRGILGQDLTPDLVQRLGKAATLWSRGGRVFLGRDTRASGPELEEAFARGVVEAGGNAVAAGVLPTPAVALLAPDPGVVVSASHHPPAYHGIKFFDPDGPELPHRGQE